VVVTRSHARRLSGRPRRLTRASHVVASSAWVGLSVAMTTIALTGALTADPATAAAGYDLMAVIGTRAIAAAAIATLVTGLVLSVATVWGLVRYWWTVAKTALTIVVIVSAVGMTNGWVERAADAARGLAGERAPSAWLAVAGAAGHLILLVAATVISVDKPWGRIRRAGR
jgi:uncharacterized membrane protein